MNTKTDGISSGLVAVAWMTDEPQMLFFDRAEAESYCDEDGSIPLVRLSDAEAIIVAKDAEIERLKAMLPDRQKRARECKTLEDWKYLALYYESQWADCSYGFNLHAGKQAERIKELESHAQTLEEVIQSQCENVTNLATEVVEQSAALKLARDALTDWLTTDLDEQQCYEAIAAIDALGE